MPIIVYVYIQLGMDYFKAMAVKRDFIPDMIKVGLANIPVKIAHPQVYLYVHNNRYNQAIPTNGHPQINIWLSGYALTSEHVFRGS